MSNRRRRASRLHDRRCSAFGRRAGLLSVAALCLAAWLAPTTVYAGRGPARLRWAKKTKTRDRLTARTRLRRRKAYSTHKPGSRLRKLIDKSTISPIGHVDSVQRARYSPSASGKRRTARDLEAAYARRIASLPFMRAVATTKGGVAFKLGPISLIELGPPSDKATRQSIRRRIVGGLLVPKTERGRGWFEVRSSHGNKSETVVLGIYGYRSKIRGTRAKAPVREFIYKATQLAIHKWVALSFLKSLADDR